MQRKETRKLCNEERNQDITREARNICELLMTQQQSIKNVDLSKKLKYLLNLQ